MPDRIMIKAGSVEVQVKLNDTRTAMTLLQILPIKSKVNIWGDEIYFDVALKAEIENGKQVVELGDVAYWPEGPSLCLFFGPTPASSGNEIRAASPVTIVGRIIGDSAVLRKVRPGDEIIVLQTQP